jgi:LacI family transcriptional regulator
MKPSGRVTMKDIAREAGVTTSAVSLVFTGKPGVAAATRERVLRVARRLGYVMDPYTSTLMTNRRKGKLPASSPVLAFASAYPTPTGWRNHSPTFVDYFQGASARAAEKGFRLESFWLGKDGQLGRRARSFTPGTSGGS